ncbi:MAG: Por secretion system protein, partial [Bacteroidota bacterium]|nr:Por secretion system protein [Bacteroidota bacterium]
SGLNTSGNGIGHDLQLVIDEDPEKTYTLNNQFVADIGSFNSGQVTYVLPELKAGLHTLRFRAWDVQNNASTQQLTFKVVPGTQPSLSHLIWAQQSDGIQFRFMHNRPDVSVTVRLTIYNLLGQEVWSEEQAMQTGELVSDVFVWNCTGNSGLKAIGGIYLCRVTMTDANGAQSFLSEKIRVLPQ